ncbi:MAG: hypothetical protein ACI9FG_000603 [Crocinitomicaceae bacterium]|jgi:hypothetical protein
MMFTRLRRGSRFAPIENLELQTVGICRFAPIRNCLKTEHSSLNASFPFHRSSLSLLSFPTFHYVTGELGSAQCRNSPFLALHILDSLSRLSR